MSFLVEKKSYTVVRPRAPGSTIAPTDNLQIVYNKYKSTEAPRAGVPTINLVFTHGTGMTKAVWTYHIAKLYTMAKRTWQLGTVVALDAVNHGDSALANEGKLGYAHPWEQGGMDINQVVLHEQSLGEFKGSHTIVVGHSLGASQAVLGALLDPYLYDSVLAIEPVMYVNTYVRLGWYRMLEKLNLVLKDKFVSGKDFEAYFRRLPFMAKFHPQVLKDLMDDERHVVNGEVSTKTSKDQQLLSLYWGEESLKLGMSLLPHAQVHIHHVAGAKAFWNPPETTSFIRSTVPSSKLSFEDFPNGSHNLHAEFPNETVQLIDRFICQRVVAREKESESRFGMLVPGPALVKTYLSAIRKEKARAKL